VLGIIVIRLILSRGSYQTMIVSMDIIRKKTDKLDLELEEAYREFDKTKAILEKKIALYSRYENSDSPLELIC
jgi:hypothetical protein